jgi:N6-L-threonylcarbamoyladenine synthase
VLVLGIESSCDETAAAVVQTDAVVGGAGSVLSDVVHSQVAVHAPFGGVVPELASRDHMRNIRPVVEAALDRAGVSLNQLDGIGVTCRPGLSGALMVGVQVAAGLGWAADKRVVGVDHLVGHLLAAFCRYPDVDCPAPPEYPFVALIASGGHTALYRVDAPFPNQIVELGATRDDAAGEAYDKTAKLLGLGYPGGPIIDRLAAEGDADAVELSRPMAARDSLEFSFSGLKTNVARWVETNGLPGNDRVLRDLCAAFQRRVVDALVSKAIRATRRQSLRTLVLGGGVAANRALRAQASAAGERHGIRVVVPAFKCCTDNAAMIAYAASQRLAAGEDDRGSLEINPRTVLPRMTRKGKGPRREA